MRIELLTQPDASSTTLFEFAEAVLGDPEITRFVAVTAWVNHRGLSRLVPALQVFRTRPGAPGSAEIIVGIDEGGATEQGLRLAAAEFDRSSVVFTIDDRTFHPKLYFGSGDRKARLLVGSNNLTPGGLFYNFEAALIVDLSIDSTGPADDRALAQGVRDYIDRLYRDTVICKPLPPNLNDIIRDPTYRVRDEAVRRPQRGTEPLDPDADREVVQRPPLFGLSAEPLRPRVPPGAPIPSSFVGGGAPAGAAPAGGAPGSAVASPTTGRLSPPAGVPGTRSPVRHRWFRVLDRTAAQRPPDPDSSPTGNLRLTQAGHGIDQTQYFRYELFGGLPWISTTVARGVRETATIPMAVVIDGRSFGTREFTVSHAAFREQGQGNVTTVLHFRAIANELRATDYTGRIITLEQLASGDYRLVIDATETGPFVR